MYQFTDMETWLAFEKRTFGNLKNQGEKFFKKFGKIIMAQKYSDASIHR